MHALKNPPLGVKSIAILNYISAGFLLLGSILFLVAGILLIQNHDSYAVKLLDQFKQGNVTAELGADNLAKLTSALQTAGPILIGLAAAVLFLGILNIVMGVGLWRGRRWAYVLELILSGLGLLLALYGLFKGSLASIVSLVVHGGILLYLSLSGKVKAFFKH